MIPPWPKREGWFAENVNNCALALASVGQEYLGAALAGLRRADPKVKVKTLDLTTGQQIMALGRGEIDLALILARSCSARFSRTTVAAVPSLVVLPLNHQLASEGAFRFSIEERPLLAGAGHVCAGIRFKKSPNSAADLVNSNLDSPPCASLLSLADGLSIAANDDEISVNPIFISHLKIPNVVMIPVADSEATWDVFVAWQSGKTWARCALWWMR